MALVLLGSLLLGPVPFLSLLRRTSKDPVTSQIRFVDPYPVALAISLVVPGVAFFMFLA